MYIAFVDLTALQNLKRIIKENFNFYYNNEEITSKEELKQLIKDGLKLEDLTLNFSDSSSKMFDVKTNDHNSCEDLFWLDCEDAPDELIYSGYHEEYIHQDNAVLCWINRRNQEYVNRETEDLARYNGDYYLYDILGECDLYDYEGEIYDLDDMAFCEDLGEYVPARYAHWSEEDECYYYERSNINKNGLKGYHDSEIKDKSANAKMKIGFEVEKEDSNFSDFSNVRALNWDAERDGSLNSNGFELVSAIYDLEDLTQFKEDASQIKNYLNADSSKNCGGHINVSIQDKTNKEVFNLIRGFVPLIYAMYYGRLENRFAMAKKINDLGDYNRYDAFNFTKSNGILEIRIFSAVKNIEQLIWRAELMALMFKHSRKGSASVLKMLFTDSPIKAHLLKIYDLDKFNKLIDRVIKYTDIYMTAKDSQQTARIIIDYKNKAQTLKDAQTIIEGIKLTNLKP
jgi:hypothetical protein